VRRGRCCCQIKRTFRAARRIFFPQGDAAAAFEALRRQQRAGRYTVFSQIFGAHSAAWSNNGNDAAAAAMTPIFFFLYGNEHRFQIPLLDAGGFLYEFSGPAHNEQ
jgi:hypothetical protein